MISTAAGPVRRNRHAARIPVSEKGLVRFASILVQSDAVRKLRTHGWFAVGMFLILAFPALAGEKKIIAGYFPQWGVYTRNYHVTNVPAARISHLIYAFAKPVYDELDDAGSVVSSDIIADLENLYPGDTTNQPVRGNFNQLARLKNIYPHLRTLISVGGWTLSDDFSDIAASSNARSTFAASAVSFMTNYGFDGIDLDWEFPVSGGKQGMMHRPEDDNNYVLLSAAIRLELDRQATIHGRPYLLTATGGAAYTSVTNRYRLAEMAAYLDWFNVMAYNYSGDWSALSGHGAPLYANPAAEVPDFNIDRTVQAYFDAGVAPEKMVLGMSFVGFGLKEVGTNAGGLFQPHGGAGDEGSWGPGFFDYRDLQNGIRDHNYINEQGFVRYWDSYSQVPYLFNATSHVFISYEDGRSISSKTKYAITNQMAGVMFWGMDADTGDAFLHTIINRLVYPVRFRSVTWTNSGPAIQLGWYALTGQTYTVEFRSNLLAGDWGASSTMVNTSGIPVNDVAGADCYLDLVDTNAFRLPEGFYRILRTPVNDVP